MSSADFVTFALQLAAMLTVAVGCGQLMCKLQQPAVLGEMIGGIVLGPTIFGALAPALYTWLFLSSADVTVARDAAIRLGMLFFLFVAGMEINLSDLRRVGRRAVLIGLVGTVLPIAIGVSLVYALPGHFWGPTVQEHFLPFALFMGMNLANSANPVIARILMDLDLLQSEIGTTIMTATIVDDLVNWTLFAIILRAVVPTNQAGAAPLPVSIGLVLIFFVAVLGLGRWLRLHLLAWVEQHVNWPTGLIGVTAVVILLTSSGAELVGIHAFLGAFLVGAALAGDERETRAAHAIISPFALSFFAPLYFVSMGLHANFITHFDVGLVLLIVVVALLSKLGSVLLGERLAGMPITRDTVAIAFGLNARGATGILLAGVGLANGVIDERLFVAMVVMCLITSLIAGPAMQALVVRRPAVQRPGEVGATD